MVKIAQEIVALYSVLTLCSVCACC